MNDDTKIAMWLGELFFGKERAMFGQTNKFKKKRSSKGSLIVATGRRLQG